MKVRSDEGHHVTKISSQCASHCPKPSTIDHDREVACFFDELTSMLRKTIYPPLAREIATPPLGDFSSSFYTSIVLAGRMKRDRGGSPNANMFLVSSQVLVRRVT